MTRIGNFLFHWRNALFPAAMLLVLLPGEALFDDPVIAAGLGLLIALGGQGVRVVTIGYEYIVRGGRDRRVYAEGLVTGGIYQLSRNPMYVGNLLILAGLAVASNSWTCLLIALPLFLFVYRAIIAAEEDYLAGRFGDRFRDYCADVPRWLPGLHALRRHFATGSTAVFHWRRVLVKEYGTPMGWISMMLVLLMHHLHARDELDDRPILVIVVVIAYALVAIAYLRVRSLKLRRRLVAD